MNITVKLYKSELIYDVQNDGHIIAQAKINKGTATKEAFGLQADNAADTKKLLRSMQTNVQEVKNRISYFLQNSVSSQVADNAQLSMTDANDAIELTLIVSDRFNPSFIEPLTMHCHNFVLNRMLRDWFLATSPELAQNYDKLAEAASINIQNSFVKLPPVAPEHNS